VELRGSLRDGDGFEDAGTWYHAINQEWDHKSCVRQRQIELQTALGADGGYAEEKVWLTPADESLFNTRGLKLV
jgi:hypothetical protein